MKKMESLLLAVILSAGLSVSALAAETVTETGKITDVAGEYEIKITGVVSKEKTSWETNDRYPETDEKGNYVGKLKDQIEKHSGIMYTVNPDFTVIVTTSNKETYPRPFALDNQAYGYQLDKDGRYLLIGDVGMESEDKRTYTVLDNENVSNPYKTVTKEEFFSKCDLLSCTELGLPVIWLRLAGQSTPTEQPATGTFTDVAATSPYAAAVKWAVEKNITAGTTATTFAPAATCTNAQILTFLWRASGQPEPAAANPFTDVAQTNYYYKAALWAHEKGLVSGTVFGSAEPCTRAQTVTYLWTLAGKPAAAKALSFTDVAADADYAQAVAWAVEKGITTGTGATTFAPDTTCTRGQIVTFLYRDMK